MPSVDATRAEGASPTQPKAERVPPAYFKISGKISDTMANDRRFVLAFRQPLVIYYDLLGEIQCCIRLRYCRISA